MKIINIKDCPKKLMKAKGTFGVDMCIALGRDDGVPHYSMRAFTMIPGSRTQHHDHPFEHMIFVASGEGILYIEDDPYHLKAGDCVYINKGWEHHYENIAEADGDDFVFVCFVPKSVECGCPDDSVNDDDK